MSSEIDRGVATLEIDGEQYWLAAVDDPESGKRSVWFMRSDPAKGGEQMLFEHTEQLTRKQIDGLLPDPPALVLPGVRTRPSPLSA
jgi:hypothetical protein